MTEEEALDDLCTSCHVRLSGCQRALVSMVATSGYIVKHNFSCMTHVTQKLHPVYIYCWTAGWHIERGCWSCGPVQGDRSASPVYSRGACEGLTDHMTDTQAAQALPLLALCVGVTEVALSVIHATHMSVRRQTTTWPGWLASCPLRLGTMVAGHRRRAEGGRRHASLPTCCRCACGCLKLNRQRQLQHNGRGCCHKDSQRVPESEVLVTPLPALLACAGAYAQGAGRALAISALDLMGHNPWSRLPNSEHRSLEGARSWLLACMRSSEDTRANELPPMDDASVRSVASLGLGTDAGTTAASRKPRGALPPRGSGRLAGPAGGAAARVAFGSAVSVPEWRTKPTVDPWARSSASTSTSKPAANSATAATAVEGRVAGLKATSASSSGASSSANATKTASHSTSASGVNAGSSAAAARAHSLELSSLRSGHPAPSSLPAAISNSQFMSTAKAAAGGRASPSLPSISSGEAKSLRPASSLAQRLQAPLALPKNGTGGPAKPGPGNDAGLAHIQRHSAPGSDGGGSTTQRPDANSVQAHVGIAYPSADASAQACGADWTAPVPALSDGLGAGGLPGMAGFALHAPCADGDDDDGEGSDSDGSDHDEIGCDVQGGASARVSGSTAASDSAWHLPDPCPERIPQSGDVQGALSSLQQAVQPAMTAHTAENLSSGTRQVENPNGLGPALNAVPLAAAASNGSSAGPAVPLHRRPPAQGQAASDKGGRVLQGCTPVPAGVGVPAQKVALVKAGSGRAAAGQVLQGSVNRSASAVTKAKPISRGAVQSAAAVKLTGSPLIAMPAASGKGLRTAPKLSKK